MYFWIDNSEIQKRRTYQRHGRWATPKFYMNISQAILSRLERYEHLSINNSLHFKDSDAGAHIKIIEST